MRAGVSESSAERRRVRRRATQSEQLVQGRVDLDMRRIEMLFEEPLHLELNSKFLNNSIDNSLTRWNTHVEHSSGRG